MPNGTAASKVVIVAPPDTGEAAYARYVVGYDGDDGTEAEPQDWAEEVAAEFEERLVDELDNACTAMRLATVDRVGLSSPPMDHDLSFSTIAWGATVEVGWRAAEGGYEVAVMPTGPFRAALAGGDASELVRSGRSPREFAAAHAACVGAVAGYLSRHLAETGFDVPKTAARGGARTVRERLDATERTAEENLGRIDPGERLEVIAAISECAREGRTAPARMLVAAYDPDSQTLFLMRPGEAGGPCVSHPVPARLEGVCRGLPVGQGIVALPASKAATDWMRSVSGGRTRAFVVAADEFEQALGEDCVVSWDGDAGQVEVANLTGGSAPRP